MKKKKRKSFRSKIRIFVSLIIFCLITVTLGYNCLSNILQIKEMKKEMENLKKQLVYLKDEKEALETDILKLQDPDYIAKYVREKYFYSKDGEVILRLGE